jgi:hypothetical protein
MKKKKNTTTAPKASPTTKRKKTAPRNAGNPVVTLGHAPATAKIFLSMQRYLRRYECTIQSNNRTVSISSHCLLPLRCGGYMRTTSSLAGDNEGA